MIVINIILFIILFLLIIYVVNYKKHLTKVNFDNIQKNKEFEEKQQKLFEDITETESQLKYTQKLYNSEIDKLEQMRDQVIEFQNMADKAVKEAGQKAFAQYHETLERAYEDAEVEYDSLMEYLKDAYDNAQFEYQQKLNQAQAELDKIYETRKAAIAAQLREEEIKEKLDFYCLTPKTADLDDIQVLERIKYKLHNPRILSMLIWSTYFQKEMTALCNRILGVKTVTGIYKITNQENEKCYIGQSVDVAKRWKDHAKCGLGIDAPQGNKLYKEMQDIGIWKFSWELIEECPRDQLNEKEKYYINLYQSKDYGYNTVKGNG